MGVKDLWSILSPTSELLPLSALAGKVIAIDLSCWICDSQNLNIGKSVTRPYIRNLLFRIISLLKAKILPIFVLEGEAPEMKWTTIENRINRDNKNKNVHTMKSGKRSRLKGLIGQCCQLLELIGLPWVQATGEAEATCAALCYHKIADGVITQDSDVFLYGATSVYRNFSGNQQKATVEQYVLTDITEKLHLSRESMIMLAILLGCDYLPTGVPGVGKEMAMNLLNHWEKLGISNPISRMKNWTSKNCVISKSTKAGKKCNKDIEESMIEKSSRVPGFPFDKIIDEFKRKLPKPFVQTTWRTPDIGLINWLVKKLDWDEVYTFEKVAPIISLWILRNPRDNSSQVLKLENILRKRVRNGEDSFEVEWRLELRHGLSVATPSTVITIEEASLLRAKFPSQIRTFEEELETKKKSKKTLKSTRRKIKKKETNKENIPQETSNMEAGVDSDSEDLSFIIDKFMNLGMKPMDTLRSSDKTNYQGIGRRHVEPLSTVLGDHVNAEHVWPSTALGDSPKTKHVWSSTALDGDSANTKHDFSSTVLGGDSANTEHVWSPGIEDSSTPFKNNFSCIDISSDSDIEVNGTTKKQLPRSKENNFEVTKQNKSDIPFQKFISNHNLSKDLFDDTLNESHNQDLSSVENNSTDDSEESKKDFNLCFSLLNSFEFNSPTKMASDLSFNTHINLTDIIPSLNKSSFEEHCSGKKLIEEHSSATKFKPMEEHCSGTKIIEEHCSGTKLIEDHSSATKFEPMGKYCSGTKIIEEHCSGTREELLNKSFCPDSPHLPLLLRLKKKYGATLTDAVNK